MNGAAQDNIGGLTGVNIKCYYMPVEATGRRNPMSVFRVVRGNTSESAEHLRLGIGVSPKGFVVGVSPAVQRAWQNLDFVYFGKEI